MAGRRALAVVVSVAMLSIVWGTVASANSDSVSGSPLTCTTSPDFGNQTASWTSTVSDDHDPAAVGDTLTYRFVVPFAQNPPPVSANYRGGTVHYKIPTGFTVSSLRTENPPGGSPIATTAAVQAGDVVVTSTADFPMDGTRYPTPDLIVTGTVGAGAAGPGVVWGVPHLVIANVYVNGFGMVVATCTPTRRRPSSARRWYRARTGPPPRRTARSASRSGRRRRSRSPAPTPTAIH